MQKKKEKEDLFDIVVDSNDGITRRNVQELFVWYDLLSYVLPLQIILIVVYLLGSRSFPITMFSVLFVFVMDAALKNALERDGRNYQKLNKYVALVKLWVIPLLFMGCFTTIVLVMTTLGLV